ncbi:uncharacterized protein EV422DRAFT_567786 [Fimicolochytrium jonesii]|uniref:uncharacterized protein n=1 Tax=Fimicolochytrium jonesii TaxID=1396493 RepID=UPI0022FE3886|nr:uncharacterized protein EV422DRAFT_567786 [Fimicolochytrium jonesii]KAI8820356.1 hypothetical protein EV422DRAFT_567786 [Fimicolochytrium jonesii]
MDVANNRSRSSSRSPSADTGLVGAAVETPPSACSTSQPTKATAAPTVPSQDWLAVCGDPIVVLSSNDHRIEFTNDAFAREISSGAFHRRSFTQNFVHPDDVQAVVSLLTTFRQVTGAVSASHPQPVRARFQTLRVTEGMPKYATYDWTISLHPGTSSLVLIGRAVDGPVRDISRAAEFEDFFENAPIALHWLSAEGIVLWANKTELNFLGYTKEEYFGRQIMDFCPDEAVVLEIFKQLGSGSAIHDVPVRIRHKDGTIKDVLIDSNVNYHPDGSFHHTRCFIRDDTKRKTEEAWLRAQIDAAESAAAAKDDFLHAFAHDIRTPMQALLGTVQLLSMTTLDEEQVDFVDTILSSGDELCNMLDNIMDAVKFKHGMPVIQVKSEVFDLKAEIENVIKRLAVLLYDRDVLLSLAWHSAIASTVPKFVMGDPVSFKRVLMNLISNSMRFTRKGFITVSVKYDRTDPEGMPFRFSVVDTGSGVSKEDAPHVFQKYWKKDAHAGRGIGEFQGPLGTGGSGLGLNTCKMLVEAMGGVIGLETVDERKGAGGAVFWFKLPLRVVPDPTTGGINGIRSPPSTIGSEHSELQRRAGVHGRKEIDSVERWMEGVTATDKTPADAYALSECAPPVSNDDLHTISPVNFHPSHPVHRAFTTLNLNGYPEQGAARSAIDAVVRQSQAAIESIMRNNTSNVVAPDRILPSGHGFDNLNSLSRSFLNPCPQSDLQPHAGSGRAGAHGHGPYDAAIVRSRESLTAGTIQEPFNGSQQHLDQLQRPHQGHQHQHLQQHQHLLHHQHLQLHQPLPHHSRMPLTSVSSRASETNTTSSGNRSEPSFSVVSTPRDVYQPLNLRVIVAEDNPLCQKVARQILRKLNCTVDLASDGIELINMYASRHPGKDWDVILCDLRMPNMSGTDASRHLREVLGCGVPIIAVTAERGAAERRECFKIGMVS